MKHISLLLSIVVLLSCNSNPEEKQSEQQIESNPLEARQDSLFSEVMAIHDEVMPEMEHIFRLQKRLKESLDSLSGQDVSPVIPLDSINALSAQLKEADDAMMNWMRSNDFQFEGMTHEEIINELTSDKESIIVVRDKMLSSIQQAEEVLQKIENP